MKTAVSILTTLCLVLAAGTAYAADAERATPEEMFRLVLKGVYVMENLGEDGLAAFNDPKGEFVYKDTYAYVSNCEQMIMAAHPYEQVRGAPSEKIRCAKSGYEIMEFACKNLDSEGTWFEFYWPKLGADGKPTGEVYRKIGFAVQVPGMPYQVGSGIYNDDLSLEEVREMAKTWRSEY